MSEANEERRTRAMQAVREWDGRVDGNLVVRLAAALDTEFWRALAFSVYVEGAYADRPHVKEMNEDA
jgi:hypothetical protein